MTLFVAFEILGTIAFAVSGAVVAISKKMDIFGVAILGMTTAVGGGILRDLILGITPPAAFQSPGYALTSIAVSMLVFLPPVRRLLHWNEKLYDTALLLFDAIGLGIFTVIGVQTAYIATGELNAFLAIFVGVVTGCGGGVMRDVFAGSPPYIFVKHFYATASLLGSGASDRCPPCSSAPPLRSRCACLRRITAGACRRRNKIEGRRLHGTA